MQLMALLALTLVPSVVDADSARLFDAGQYESAKSALISLPAEEYEQVIPLNRMARILIRERDGRGAMQALKMSLALDETNPTTHYLAGVANILLIGEVNLFKKLGVVKHARRSWERSIELDPDHVKARYALLSFYANAPRIAGGSIGRAKEHFALLGRSNLAYFHLSEALFFEKDGDIEAATKGYDDAIASSAERNFPIFGKAQFLFRQKQHDDAIALFESYRAKAWDDPSEMMVHMVLGNIFKEKDQVERAREEFELALGMDPDTGLREFITDRLQELY